MAMNGRVLGGGRYVVSSESEHSESDSQGTTQHVDEWMYNPNSSGDHHRLSVIPEHLEGVVEGSPGTRGVAVGRGGVNMVVPVYVHAQDSDSEVRILVWEEGWGLERGGVKEGGVAGS